jgi:hypothetical protein
MKLAIMQPYFFPYIGYFQAINAVDKYILYENLNYIKEGWINRNRVLIKNQTPSYFSVIMDSSSSNKKIYEIKLSSTFNWRKKLLNKVFLNYKGSAFFDETYALITACINIEEEMLFAYNAGIIKKIAEYLEIKTEIQFDNRHYLALEDSLILEASRKSNTSIKARRVFEICKKEKATIFINAIGGFSLYDKNEFKDEGIELLFIESGEIVYKQFSEEFYPKLSIIDILMHNGKDQVKNYLNRYSLI